MTTWRKKLGDVAAFVDEHGTFPSVYSSDALEAAMASWCAAQRFAYERDDLSQKYIDMLQSIPGWAWNRNHKSYWKYGLGELKSFVDKHGRLPFQRKPDSEGKIACWCNRQRRKYKRGKLSQEHIEDLESITGWTWSNHLLFQKKLNANERKPHFSQSFRRELQDLQL